MQSIHAEFEMVVRDAMANSRIFTLEEIIKHMSRDINREVAEQNMKCSICSKTIHRAEIYFFCKDITDTIEVIICSRNCEHEYEHRLTEICNAYSNVIADLTEDELRDPVLQLDDESTLQYLERKKQHLAKLEEKSPDTYNEGVEVELEDTFR